MQEPLRTIRQNSKKRLRVGGASIRSSTVLRVQMDAWSTNDEMSGEQQMRTAPPPVRPALVVLFRLGRYALSYDWSQGVEHAKPQATNNIYVHAVADDEIKPRPKDKK